MKIFALALILLVGCAAKKPQSYHFQGCRVTGTIVDQHGVERKDCDCVGRVIGMDAKTKATLIRCQ